MQDEFLALRRRVYEAGAVYDESSRLCNDALTNSTLEQALWAVKNYETATKDYGVALLRLAEYTDKSESNDVMVEERRRVQKLLSLLDQEAETVNRRLEILKRSS